MEFNYKGFTVTITNNNRYFDVVEFTPIMKQKVSIISGASEDAIYTEDVVKAKIDNMLEQI